ncbi:lipopolysaccharide-induced tumor necrosis factor-alpha factor homolog isoform X2 [Drosophila busckii]|uniref:lipopolysaccharide-induced tumor necrosis factor-alpha factor homolog isoform X2 n=1 Tax=Drosophila busckii TaxID=30019 RepID=UPI00083E9B04|nr:lipopolysaccharide-induced tumor necrosis factor-alpha factor homolog isoform X2 [Drosophila busckii]
MESKNSIYPEMQEAPPHYGELGSAPTMIPSETTMSAPGMTPAVINVTPQQPVFMVQTQNNLGKNPTLATCPSCQERQMTIVKYEPSTKTHLFALAICLVGGICCCCIPYCVDSCQSAVHSCKNCGAFVGAYQN